MSAATVFLIVALVSLSISIAGGIYIWRRHSYSVRDERFQVDLWRSEKSARTRYRIREIGAQPESSHDARAYALAEMAAANDPTDADAIDYG